MSDEIKWTPSELNADDSLIECRNDHGYELRKLRVSLGLSLREAAEGMKLDVVTLGALERGAELPKSWLDLHVAFGRFVERRMGQARYEHSKGCLNETACVATGCKMLEPPCMFEGCKNDHAGEYPLCPEHLARFIELGKDPRAWDDYEFDTDDVGTLEGFDGVVIMTGPIAAETGLKMSCATARMLAEHLLALLDHPALAQEPTGGVKPSRNPKDGAEERARDAALATVPGTGQPTSGGALNKHECHPSGAGGAGDTYNCSCGRTWRATATSWEPVNARFDCAECALGRDCELHDPPPEPRPANPTVDEPPLRGAAPTFDAVLAHTRDWTLLDALVHVALWENDRAVRQALRGERDPHTQALWDTCFKHAFAAVLAVPRMADALPRDEAAYAEGVEFARGEAQRLRAMIVAFVSAYEQSAGRLTNETIVAYTPLYDVARANAIIQSATSVKRTPHALPEVKK